VTEARRTVGRDALLSAHRVAAMIGDGATPIKRDWAIARSSVI
jgi:hypothetical protein